MAYHEVFWATSATVAPVLGVAILLVPAPADPKDLPFSSRLVNVFGAFLLGALTLGLGDALFSLALGHDLSKPGLDAGVDVVVFAFVALVRIWRIFDAAEDD